MIFKMFKIMYFMILKIETLGGALLPVVMTCVWVVTVWLRVYVGGKAVWLEECEIIKSGLKLFAYIIKYIVVLFAIVILSWGWNWKYKLRILFYL